jgi:LytS/YehU family sensor histidine kinase
MAELELQSLRAQLNPHFMFNCLTAIQELILKEDFENSQTYLARFAKLLRMLVENTETPFTPLQKEIDLLELYLSLEKLRLPDLRFSITADPSINKDKTLIPNMILQPYIENALWHGLSPKTGDKKLEVNIQKQNGNVIYNVKDNGVGRKRSSELKSLYRRGHKSKGVELLTKRFKLLSEEYGSDITTEVIDVMNNGKAGGTEVAIIVPDSFSQKYQK